MTYARQSNRAAANGREWVVLANAARARIFERDPETGAMRELSAHVHPQSRAKGIELGADRPGRAIKGQARTRFEPHTPPHERETQRFAHELAEKLERGALAHRYAALVLLASDPFLGQLRRELGPAATALLGHQLARDLTAWQDRELEERVARAIGTHEAV